MSAALMLFALGSMPALPEEPGHLSPAEPQLLIPPLESIVAFPDRLPDMKPDLSALPPEPPSWITRA